MNLDVNGTIIQNAAPEDVARALKTPPSSGDWSIVVENGKGGYIQGYAESGMQFRLTCQDKNSQYDGKELVDAPRLKTILTSYLKGEKGWRGAISWGPPQGDRDEFTLIAAAFDQLKQLRAGKHAKLAPGELSPLTIIGAMAVVGLFLVGVFALPKLGGLLSHLPWPFDSYAGQLLLLVVLVPIGITFVVARSKLSRIQQAAALARRTGPGDRVGGARQSLGFDNRKPAVRESSRACATNSRSRAAHWSAIASASATTPAAPIRKRRSRATPSGARSSCITIPMTPAKRCLRGRRPKGWAADVYAWP